MASCWRAPVLLVQQQVDPGEGRLEECVFVGVERGGELVGEVKDEVAMAS